MGIWEDLLRAGYQYAIDLEVDGLGPIFTETRPRRVDSSAEMGAPSGRTICAALVFDSGQVLSQEIDRETGVARGDAVDFCLAWEPLEEDGVTTTLFARPTRRARLTADLAAGDTSADVDSTAGWTAGDTGYIGLEMMELGAITDGDTFGSITRGIAGHADQYKASSPTSFSFITDKPEIFRGRKCRLRMHMLSPEGRALDATWTSGTWNRIFWEGSIDEQPRPTELGMVLRALPLPRLASQEIGYEISMAAMTPVEDPLAIAAFPIVAQPGSYVLINGTYSGPSSGTFNARVPSYTTETATTVGGWAAELRADLETALAAEPWFTAGEIQAGIVGAQLADYGYHNGVPIGTLDVRIAFTAAYTVHITITVLPTPDTYWLRPGVFEGYAGLMNQPIFWWKDQLRVQMDHQAGAWLPVVQTEGQGYQDLEIPSSGAAIAEVDGEKELIRWDRIVPGGTYDGRLKLLHISERGAGGTSLIALAADTELKFVSGHTGTVGEIICTLLESSGTGARGAYDTMPVGLGFGVADDAIDEAAITADSDLNLQTVAAYADGRTSIEELVGGWLAIHAKCLVMRRNEAGDFKLTIVDAEPFGVHAFTAALARADVELSSIGTPEPVAFGNEVKVTRSSIVTDTPPVIVQDVIAIQAAGPRSIEFTCPGMSETLAIQLAASRIAAGLGTATLQVALAPWFDRQVGDLLAVTLAHPASYDWATGTRAPARIAAIFSGEQFTPYDGRRVGVFVLAGILREGLFLCPTATVLTVPTTSTVTTDIGSVASFSPNDLTFFATFYNPGNEATESAELEVLADFELASGTWPAWVAPGTKITFAALGGGNHPDLEPVHIFQAPSRNWAA